jgi:hypothetical protein
MSTNILSKFIPLNWWGRAPICVAHPRAGGGIDSGLSPQTQAALGIAPCGDPRIDDLIVWVRRDEPGRRDVEFGTLVWDAPDAPGILAEAWLR